jgi:crossover junction endodeoxyribonuclease RuvC
MRVLGIDCGIAITGWGVLEKQPKQSNQLRVIEYGIIRTEAKEEMPKRLNRLYLDMRKVIAEFKPDLVAIEDLFYFKNKKTIISVGQGRGVAILAAVRKKVPITHYTPLQVKQSVAGYGKASKEQVQRMVKAILKLKEIPKPDDAADALAIAICHLNMNKKLVG